MSKAKLDALLERIPDLKGGKVVGPEPERAAGIFEAALEGGWDGLRELIDRLREVDDGTDWKARYLLHGLGMYVGDPERRGKRSTYLAAVTDALGEDRPAPVKAFLVRELRWAGDAGAVDALRPLLDDGELREPATQALVAIGGRRAAEALRAALAGAGRDAGPTVVRALGALGDEAAADGLRTAASSEDLATRLAALWALAELGDAASAEAALKAADGAEGWARTQATDACLRLAERLAATGHTADAARIWRQLKAKRTGAHEAHVREAAARGLEELAARA